MPPFPPSVRLVTSFDELLSTTLADGINALCWPRTLPGDYREVVEKLHAPAGITTLEEDQLLALPLSPAGREAVAAMLADQHLLRQHGLDPVLDCIHGYLPLHEDTAPLRTNVCSFHVDTATAPADTWLCTYHGPSSIGLPSDHAIPHPLVPATRAMLLSHHGGPDDETFAEYLSENFFDLHYAPLPHAQPYEFGQHHLWRIAIAHPESSTPPCIHRAPDPVPGQLPRLLLIS